MTDANSVAVERAKPRIAVLLRGFEMSPKYLDLLKSAPGDDRLAFFAFYNSFNGSFDTGGIDQLPYSDETIKKLGLVPDETFLYYCFDVLLEYARRSLPEYDLFVIIEYDVQLHGDRGRYLHDLRICLEKTQFRDIDMAGPSLKKVSWAWAHLENAKRSFDPVWMLFMPTLIVSARAIRAMFSFRLNEGALDMPSAKRAICESLVSLFANDENYKVCDLNLVCPESYEEKTFYYGLPMLITSTSKSSGAMRHPVYSIEPFLEKHLQFAINNKTCQQFISSLDLIYDLPSNLEDIFRRRAREALVVPLSCAETKCLPKPQCAIILTDDKNLFVRENGEFSRCLTVVDGKSLLLRAIDSMIYWGIEKVYVCIDANSNDVKKAVSGLFGLDNEALECLTDDDTRFVEVSRNGRVLKLICSGEPLNSQLAKICQGDPSGSYLLALANTLSDLDLSSLWCQHESAINSITLGVKVGASIAIALDESIRIVNESSPGLGNLLLPMGFAFVRKKWLEVQAFEEDSTLQSILQKAKNSSQLGLYHHEGFGQSVGSNREDLLLQQMIALFPEIVVD